MNAYVGSLRDAMRGQASVRRVPDADLPALDRYLRSAAAPEGCMQLVDLDGFLTGLVVGPRRLAPAEWLAEVWGGEAPAFISEREANQVVGAIMRRHTDISLDLASHPEAFAPLLARGADGQPDGFQWATGFRDAVRLSLPDWAPALRRGPHQALLWPIAAYWTDSDDPPRLEGIPDDALDRLRASGAGNIRAAVVALYRCWRRREPQPYEVWRKDKA